MLMDALDWWYAINCLGCREVLPEKTCEDQKDACLIYASRPDEPKRTMLPPPNSLSVCLVAFMLGPWPRRIDFWVSLLGQ